MRRPRSEQKHNVECVFQKCIFFVLMILLLFLFLLFLLILSIPVSFVRSALLRHNALGLKGGAARVPMFQTGHGLPTKRPIPGVAHVVAVASGKGGVGKSTCAGGCSRSRFLFFSFCACEESESMLCVVGFTLLLDCLSLAVDLWAVAAELLCAAGFQLSCNRSAAATMVTMAA